MKKENHPIEHTCKILDYPVSSYYRKIKAKCAQGVSPNKLARIEHESRLIELIKEIKSLHLFWGYRRIRAFIKNYHRIPISYKKVFRIMKENDLLLKPKRYKAKRTPQREKPKPYKINQWWGTDMTKFYIGDLGWVYLVVVLDWFSKKVVGYNLNVRSKSTDWIAALQMAVDNNCPLGSREYELHLMSDNGSQPTSTAYENMSKLLGIKHITTSYNNPKGNADTERFMRTFKEEVVYANEFDSFEESKKKVNDFIYFYNNYYPHSKLNYLSPVDFENKLLYKDAI